MEPATKQDLKDLLKEFREEFRRGIREAVAAGFGNSKPALEHASTPAASQLLPTDAPASPTTTVDVVPVLTASSVSAKPLDIDATGGAAPTPTTCSTDGQGHDTDGYGSLAVSQPCRLFTASRDASLTQPCRPFVVLRPDKMAPTRCSTMCFVDETSVFKYMFVAEVTQSIMRQGHVLRPVPWPSFKCHLQLAYLHAVVRKFWFVFLPLAESWYCWQYKHLQQGRPPDRACYWECMVGQGFPRSRILMVIFHPRPSSTYMEKSSPPRFHDSIWYTEDSVNYWECNRSWKLLVGRVPAFTEGRYHNHWSIFAYWGSLEFNHIILHCHRTSIFDPVHQWEFGRRTSIGVATQISGGSAAVQDTMVLMDTLLNWQFLSKEKFERSGSYSRDSIILGDKEVQIVRLLTNIYCCNTTKSEVIQGNLSSSLNIMVTWYLDHGFMRIKKWWLDIHCSQLVNESFEASFWPEQHIIGNYLQVLVTDSLLQLFWSGSTPISLLENILVLTWRSIGLSVEQLSGATYSCTVSLYVASRQWIISWLEGSFGLTTTHSSLQGEQITCSCPKTVTTQLLVSAETECLDSLLLIHAYLGGSCGLKRDINITLLHASKWSSSLHYEKLCNPSSFWSESTMYIDQFKDLFCHMDLLLACMSGQQPIVLLPGHWFVPGMEHLQVLQYTSGFPWYYYLETLKYSCYCLATEDTTGFPASCSDWMSEIKNLVSYGVQEYTVNDFSERHLCGHAASYFVLINFWAMGTGYLQILQQLGNIELKENQISNNIDEQWPGQLVFLCSISDVMAYCFMPDSHSVGLVLPSVICEVVVPPVQYVPRLLCMQPITHKNEATSTLLMGLSAWGVPWDPGDLRIVFEDIPGERNTHFVRQVLLTIPCSSLMDGVEFFTSCGQAPFQGGRNFMILAAFVDHNYYFDAILNLVPASHDEYRDPVRVNSGHGCDYEGYFGNPGEQAYYFGRVYIDLNYYHEDYHGDPSKIKELQAPWDPSKSAFQSPAKFRLGVKPSFKEGGVLATCPPGGPATTRRHQGPAHHQLPVLHGLHIQQGRQRRGHPGMDHEQAPAVASSPTSALLPQPPSCCLIFSTLVLVLASQICHQ